MPPSRNLERITGLLCHALLLVSHSSWVKGKAFFYYYFLMHEKILSLHTAAFYRAADFLER